MDGENNGNPYVQMDDLGVPLFSETPIHFNHPDDRRPGAFHRVRRPVLDFGRDRDRSDHPESGYDSDPGTWSNRGIFWEGIRVNK